MYYWGDKKSSLTVLTGAESADAGPRHSIVASPTRASYAMRLESSSCPAEWSSSTVGENDAEDGSRKSKRVECRTEIWSSVDPSCLRQ